MSRLKLYSRTNPQTIPRGFRDERHLQRYPSTAPSEISRHNGSSFMDHAAEVGRDFCNETTINGFNHIAKERRHWFERLVWLAITCAAIWGAVSVSLGQWQRYNENPTVITLDKDFRTWSFPLAAITACNYDKVNPKKLPQVINATWKVNPGHDKYDYYKAFVEKVANSDLLHLKVFENYADDPTLNVDLYRLAVGVMYDFTAKATWVKNMAPRWFPIMTEMGICYNTNSVALADVLIDKSVLNQTTQFPLVCQFADYSCFVVVENTANMTVYFHSSYEVADINTHHYKMFRTLNKVVDMSVVPTTCASGVRDLSLRRRRCRYTDENPDAPRKQVYSNNMCHRTCRNDLAVQECGCKPFYNLYEDGVPCTPAGMWCLSRIAHKMKSIKCSCALQCDDAVYHELAVDDQLWDKGLFSKKTSVKVSLQSPRARYTREIVFYFQDLIVSFGGAAGLFLGASLLSFIEIGYFIIERLFKTCARFGSNGGETPRLHEETEVERIPKTSYESRVISDLDSFLENPRYRQPERNNTLYSYL